MRTSLMALACLACLACGPRYTHQSVEANARYGNPSTQVFYTLQVDPNGLATRTATQSGSGTAPETRQLAADSFDTFKKTLVEADPMSMKSVYDPCAVAKCSGPVSNFVITVIIDGKSKQVATQLVDSPVNPQGLKDIITLITDLDATFPKPAS